MGKQSKERRVLKAQRQRARERAERARASGKSVDPVESQGSSKGPKVHVPRFDEIDHRSSDDESDSESSTLSSTGDGEEQQGGGLDRIISDLLTRPVKNEEV